MPLTNTSQEAKEKNENTGAKSNTSHFFTYKGFPLLRKNNEIYFGSMADDYVVKIQILQTKKEGDMEVASKCKIYQMSTDLSLNPVEAIVKSSEKDSLYEALDIASIWLSRARTQKR